MAINAEKCKAALKEFLERSDVAQEIKRLFLIEDKSDPQIAHIFNIRIGKGGFKEFVAPEGFALKAGDITKYRYNAKPPIKRPTDGKNTLKRAVAVTLPARKKVSPDDLEGLHTSPFGATEVTVRGM